MPRSHQIVRRCAIINISSRNRKMMHYIKVTLVLSLTVILVRSQQRAAYQKHEALLKMYPCDMPQPRVFELEEIIPQEVLKMRTNGDLRRVKPAVTVLHRCESTGCCPRSTEKCSPFDKQDVTLTFLITGPRLDFLEVPAVNHTRCMCTTV